MLAGEGEQVIASCPGQVRGGQPAYGGPRKPGVGVVTTDQEPMRLGDIPAPVQVNAFEYQWACISLRRPEDQTGVSAGLHPRHFVRDLGMVPGQAHAVAAPYPGDLAHETDCNKVAGRWVRGHVTIQQQNGSVKTAPMGWHVPPPVAALRGSAASRRPGSSRRPS